MQDGESEALPTGKLSPDDRTLELGMRRLVREQTGEELGYVEQLYTFGDLSRDPRFPDRLISVAYLALVRSGGSGSWQPIYRYFPWEDWQKGKPAELTDVIVPAVDEWMEHDLERNLRGRLMFGLKGTPWNGERVLERYELLYEIGLVPEAGGPGVGRPMALDHRRILATAMSRVRGKIRYRPVVFELLPEYFTLYQLQRTVEALSGVLLHKQNFRRLVEKQGLVEGTGERSRETGGRPAELFRFRSEVLTERPAPGVGLPRTS